jgi:hypothetical protein
MHFFSLLSEIVWEGDISDDEDHAEFALENSNGNTSLPHEDQHAVES